MPEIVPGIDATLPRLSKVSTISQKDKQHDIPASSKVTFENWAQTFTCRPELFFKPKSIFEVQEVLKLARQRKRRVAVVGAGHSPGDIVCTEDYMMSLDHMCNLLEVKRESRRVKVEAGMRLYQLHRHLENHGLGMSNLGSISEQSVGGFIATATHGSSLQHSILSQLVDELTIVLADGRVMVCSSQQNHDLFKAALVSLGAIGVIVDVTFTVSDAFDVKSTKSIVTFDNMLKRWSENALWQNAEFVRVWWFPYSDKTVVWEGERVPADTVPHKSEKSWYRSMFWAYHAQQALLSLGRFAPSYGPAIERLVFRNQYGTKEGHLAEEVERSYVSLNMNCLFSQYVNEWAIPLENGVEACRRLQLWLSGREQEARIPYSSKGIYVHAPIELRVANSDDNDGWLSTAWGGPVCYIGIIMYKPYFQPISYRRYFQAYEYLMKSLGGRPHWAKQHNMARHDLLERYPKLNDWLRVRQEFDPEGMFTTEYHKRHLLTDASTEIGVFQGQSGRKFKARL